MLSGEFKVNRCTRECYSLKRPLKPGEAFFSVVVEEDHEYQRRDYAAEAWDSPPEGAVGVWKNRMPREQDRKLVLAPREVLIELLVQMGEMPEKSKLRYILALMLLRKRMIQPVNGLDVEMSDKDVLYVEIPRDKTTLAIPMASINRAESELLTEQLNDLLYCEASELAENDDE